MLGRRQLLALCCCLVAAAAPCAADDSAVVITETSLSPAMALELALATRNACRAGGFQVSVAVVDRRGGIQVSLRDQLAGNFTHDIAVRKARTAAGFRRSTLALEQDLSERVELRSINQLQAVLMVGGGVPVTYNGSTVGAIGVSGAPSPAEDDQCASAAIDSLADKLLF